MTIFALCFSITDTVFLLSRVVFNLCSRKESEGTFRKNLRCAYATPNPLRANKPGGEVSRVWRITCVLTQIARLCRIYSMCHQGNLIMRPVIVVKQSQVFDDVHQGNLIMWHVIVVKHVFYSSVTLCVACVWCWVGDIVDAGAAWCQVSNVDVWPRGRRTRRAGSLPSMSSTRSSGRTRSQTNL